MGNKEQKFLKDLYQKDEILIHQNEIFKKYDKNNDNVLQKSVFIKLIFRKEKSLSKNILK
jgi:hypothetical protein